MNRFAVARLIALPTTASGTSSSLLKRTQEAPMSSFLPVALHSDSKRSRSAGFV